MSGLVLFLVNSFKATRLVTTQQSIASLFKRTAFPQFSNYCTKSPSLSFFMLLLAPIDIHTPREELRNRTVHILSNFRHLPSINIESLFRELRRDNRSPRELSSSKSLDSALCGLGVLVLDVDLADTETGAGTCRARDLCFDNGAVFLAFFFDVFLDFCCC